MTCLCQDTPQPWCILWFYENDGSLSLMTLYPQITHYVKPTRSRTSAYLFFDAKDTRFLQKKYSSGRFACPACSFSTLRLVIERSSRLAVSRTEPIALSSLVPRCATALHKPGVLAVDLWSAAARERQRPRRRFERDRPIVRAATT